GGIREEVDGAGGEGRGAGRGRHTGGYRDWSADVCASDLAAHGGDGRVLGDGHGGGGGAGGAFVGGVALVRRDDGVGAHGGGGVADRASLHLAGAGERAAGEGGGGGVREEVDGAGGEGRGGDRVGAGGGAAGGGAGGEGGRVAAHGRDGRVFGDGHEEGAAAGAVRAVAIVAGGDGVAACLHRARGVGHRAARRGSAATQCAAVTWGEGPTAAGRE